MSRPGASARERLADLRGRELARAEAGPLEGLIGLWIGRIRRDAWARLALVVGLDALAVAVLLLRAPKGARLRRGGIIAGAHLGALAALALRNAWKASPMIAPFAWRVLSSSSRYEYRLDEASRMLFVREASSHARPELSAEERNVLGSVAWGEGDASRGWPLRTAAAPEAVARMWATFGDLIERYAAASGVDRTLVMVQAMCEAAHSTSHPSGFNPKSSRTEKGYPDRTGENDRGDPERDARDWAASGGTRSSHGLAQALIGTAARLVPELRKMDPRSHRGWLYEPQNSWRVIALYLAQLPEHDRTDPVRARAAYNAGSVRASSSTGWGAVMWSDAVEWTLVAYWNDAAAYLAATGASAPAKLAEQVANIEAPSEQPQPADPPAVLVPTGDLVPVVAEALRAIAQDEPPALAPLSKALHDELAELLAPETNT